MFKLSASSIKKFMGSKAKWAGYAILGIKDKIPNDSFIVGKAFENYLTLGRDNLEEAIGDSEVTDLEKIVQDLDNLKYNAEGLDFTKGILQHKIEGELFGEYIVGYVYNLTDDFVEDIKTCKTLTNVNKPSVNMWSNMTNIEEYELQMWIYCKLLKRKKARILEVAKHKYKDGRHSHQIIDIEITPEFDKRMTEKYSKVITEMKALYDKHTKC